jgi:fatty-acyl-CoA synthase
MTALTPTPTHDSLPRRLSDFATLGEALDYAAQGARGINFHDMRGNLARVFPFAEMRKDALDMAYRLISHGVKPEDRIALVAETGPEFAALFFGCVYAGAWPVPLPLPTSFGGKESYIDQLSVQLQSCDPKILFFPEELSETAGEAARQNGVEGLDWQGFTDRIALKAELPEATTDEICYLQYSSGSTRFPHGVAVTHKALLNNLSAHSHGMELQASDRCVSWLPWYHDMGLVGCFLSVVANQVSTDYMKTEDFARRPLAWLDIISSRKESTVISYSPTFGYDICARRISSQTHVSERFDLSHWRLAGNGADMIRPDVMQSFVDAFGEAGFSANSFLPSYGLAEATLAVSIMPPGEGIRVELVEESELTGMAGSPDRPTRYRAIVNCGKAAKDMTIEVRDEAGKLLPDRVIGKVWCTGPSLMVGYFRDEEATAACMKDGWLDTGDMGYLSDGYVFIVGRAKDMIIINGKNHWPQDIEWAVEQLPGFKAGDIAAFAVSNGGEETPAVLVQCRTSDEFERAKLREQIKDKVRSVTGMNCVVELVPPRTLPRTSSGKLSRAKARNLYLSGEIQPYAIAA